MEVVRNLPYFLLTLAFSLYGQVLLKKGVAHVLAGSRPSALEIVRQHLPAVLVSPYVLLGVLCCGAGAICWIVVLAMFDLGKALPILGGIAYIVLFFVGRVVLKEETTWLNFSGILLIVCGLCLVSMKNVP